MPRREPTRYAYRAAQARARARAGALSARAIRNVQAAIQGYADRIAMLTRRYATNAAAVKHLADTRILMERARVELDRLLATTVATGRRAAYADVAATWERASLATARARGALASDATLFAGLREAPITLLGAYEQLGAAATWRTALPTLVGRAAAELDAIVSGALVEGVDPLTLSRRLRPYVVGSEPFHRAFGNIDGLDLRTVTGPLRGAAGQMTSNAQRIAFTELHNARAEAEVAAFVNDPFVKAIAWRLAPDRGTLTEPDECDVFATEDLYGLGAGVFPVDAVPLPPHPWDRCERVPITRGADEMNEPKPRGAFQGIAGVAEKLQGRVGRNLVAARGLLPGPV